MRKDVVVCIKITVLVVLASKRVFRILYEVPWSERVAQRVLDRHASSGKIVRAISRDIVRNSA
jgi:hypothetical protein